MSVMLLVLLELYAVDTVFIDSLVTAADSGDALSTVGKGQRLYFCESSRQLILGQDCYHC